MTLIERVKNILLSPKTEWPVIAREAGATGFLFRHYVAILAAIHAICSLIGLLTLPFATARLLPVAIATAVAGYIMAFVLTWLLALVINLLAPPFGGRPDFPNAMKLAVYSQTPYWLAGVFYLLPALSILALLGLYGIYLLWLGLPVLMQSPQEKSLIYMIAAAVSAILLYVVLGAITGALVWALVGPLRTI